MVMTGALLVYSVAQRRLRQQWCDKTRPCRTKFITNAKPTLRWVFQLLEDSTGPWTVQDHVHDLIEGLNEADHHPSFVWGRSLSSYQILPARVLNVGITISTVVF